MYRFFPKKCLNWTKKCTVFLEFSVLEAELDKKSVPFFHKKKTAMQLAPWKKCSLPAGFLYGPLLQKFKNAVRKFV